MTDVCHACDHHCRLDARAYSGLRARRICLRGPGSSGPAGRDERIQERDRQQGTATAESPTARRDFEIHAALDDRYYGQLEATIFTAETAKDILSAHLPLTVTL